MPTLFKPTDHVPKAILACAHHPNQQYGHPYVEKPGCAGQTITVMRIERA